MAERLEPFTKRTPGVLKTSNPSPRWKKRPRPVCPPVREIALHRTIAELLDWALVPPAMYTTFPAGWDKMSPAMSGMLKGCGLKAGMPDILVFHPSGRCLGIELKTGRNTQTATQKETAAQLLATGVPVIVARSVEDVLAVLERWDIPHRKVNLFTATLQMPGKGNGR